MGKAAAMEVSAAAAEAGMMLGWVAGPAVMLLFAFVIYYTSTLLAECYRSGDPCTGKRNYTYMDAVRANLGGAKVRLCGVIQYANLFGVAIGYTIAASISMLAIKRADCFHEKGHKNPCRSSSNPYMILFGVVQIVFSQIPDFDQIWWLSIVAAIMSFTYSTIGLSLGIAQTVANGGFMGSLTGISVGAGVTSMQKNRALLCVMSCQDTIKAPPPSEAKVMKRATMVSVATTTVFYMLCGCMGYAAFGDRSPDNLLTGFGFYEPFWLLDVANAAIVVHLVGAYQVFVQPIFAFVERSAFVVATTVVSMLLPFFNDVVGFLGAVGFWPLTVYFPVEMYIVQKRIPRWSTRWVCLQLLSLACLAITVASAAGSIAGILSDLKVYKPFATTY
uniref:Amino acid transporter transmembrane domain-containing protein n=1 Tax=Oryza barthii TaxID=65489 RepID=A0A0D3G7U4_9ORYZ